VSEGDIAQRVTLVDSSLPTGVVTFLFSDIEVATLDHGERSHHLRQRGDRAPDRRDPAERQRTGITGVHGDQR
jgi:hypothetical protein